MMNPLLLDLLLDERRAEQTRRLHQADLRAQARAATPRPLQRTAWPPPLASRPAVAARLAVVAARALRGLAAWLEPSPTVTSTRTECVPFQSYARR